MSDDDRKFCLIMAFLKLIYSTLSMLHHFNYTNRMALGLDMMPNKEYHSMNR